MSEKTNREELTNFVKTLVCRLEQLPNLEPVCYPSFLCEKKPRYQIDWDNRPLIVNDSLIEIRPTNEMKAMKNSGNKNDKVYIRINSPQNPHASPPWYHPCDPKFRREKAKRDMKEDIYPCSDLINPCQMPPYEIQLPKELECECNSRDKNVKHCKWKEYQYQPCSEKLERYLCTRPQ
ncbi:hypothetical protein O3M35_000530 [Rhynocoris fuscipes]|uniref:Uncharacterized protein n=1 Tax=Rhynocoris fuscipes TaxID=488301 RepID=A0AAW1DNS3_9HEMI